MKKIYSIFCCIFLSTSLFAQTEYKDVAPILIANCTGCHHQGGLTFALTNYSAVAYYANPIKYAVENTIMPPWPADPTYRNYHNERVVSQADKTTLVNWINNGMLAGDSTQAPPVPIYGNTQLQGTPDLILTIPAYTSTATSTDHYYCINVPTGVSVDRYIRAFEFIPSNPALIHHAVITIDTTGTATNDMSGSCYNFQGQINIGDFAPGMGPTVLPGVNPVKLGFRLKANAKISFQIHVPSGTNGMKDSSQLRIYFYPTNETGVRDMFFQTVLQNWSFNIPANDSIIVTQKYPTSPAGIPIDISLYGSFPHSHKTCKSILNYAFKNTDTIPLIRINKWDFHWQGQYTFKKLLKMPAGYRLFSAHKFDNTINNPETPNHNVPVLPGLGTDDEMFFDSYLFTYYLPGDELVNIDSILSVDPLLTPTLVSNFNEQIENLSVFPNPFHTATTFEYLLLKNEHVTIKLFDLVGNEIQTLFDANQTAGKHSQTFTFKQLPAGHYFYKMQVGASSKAGKLIVE